MVSQISHFITDFFIDNSIIENSERDIFRFGIECIFEIFINILVVVLAGIILGALKYALIFFLIFCILRINCGGYHAETNLKCNLILFFNVVAVILISKHFDVNYLLLIMMVIFSNATIIFVAPIKNHGNKFKSSNNNKFCCVILFLIFSILCLILNRYSKNISLLIALTMISVALAMIFEKWKGGRI